MKTKVLAVTALSAVALLAFASAALAAEAMAVDIPFDFVVGQKAMPAGHYEVQPTGDHLDRLIVKGTGTPGVFVAPVLERLANVGSEKPKLVFDKLEGKYILSEAHYPGMDGFLVGIAGGKESHEVITGSKQQRN